MAAVRSNRVRKKENRQNRETWEILSETRMWANVQRDGRPAEHRWRPPFNAAKFD